MAVKNRQPARSYTDYALASKPVEDLIHGEPTLNYDYTQVAEEHRNDVMARAKTIKRNERKTVETIIAIGHDLTIVRDKLPYGAFVNWVEIEFGWQKTVAYNMINLYQRFPPGGKLTALSISALYQLSAPTTPDSALAEAETRQAAGETITKAKANEIATRHRNPAKAATPPPPPTRPLDLNETIALIWRAIKHGTQGVPAAGPQPTNPARLAWLLAAPGNPPGQAFKDLLQPGVTFADDIFTQAFDTVAAELQSNIEHELRTQAASPLDPTIMSTPVGGGPMGAVGELVEPVGEWGPSGHEPPATQKMQLSPPPAQLERLPAYLIQAGCTLTRLLDGILMANYNGHEHPFPPAQIATAVSWLDTQVRANFNNLGLAGTPDTRIQRLLSSALPYLKEARTVASEASQRARAAKLADAILLIEQVIE